MQKEGPHASISSSATVLFKYDFPVFWFGLIGLAVVVALRGGFNADPAHGGWYRDPSVPESKEAFEEIARFFDKHLGK
jgi:hypothetical protein